MCNRNINSAAGSFVVVIILYFNDSFRIGSFFTDFMKRADAGSIGTGVDNTILIDEINIVSTNVMDGIYNLCSELFSNLCDHGYPSCLYDSPKRPYSKKFISEIIAENPFILKHEKIYLIIKKVNILK